jgi:hypothetical protein
MKGFDIYETIVAAFSMVQADLELLRQNSVRRHSEIFRQE